MAAVFGASLCAAAPASATATTYQLSMFAGTGTAGSPIAGAATSSHLDFPEGVTVDAAGDVYVADSENNEVEKINPAGQLSIVAGDGSSGAPTPGPATSSALDTPTGVAVDGTGNVYIADRSNDVVERVTPSGTLSIFAGNGSGTGTPTAGPATATTIGTPWGVAVDDAGNVYISGCASGCRVYKVTPSGTLSIFAGNGSLGSPTPGPAVSSPLGAPLQLAVDASGDLFIADYEQNVIEKVTASGTLSIVAGSGIYGTQVPGPATSSPLRSPYGIAVDAAGDLYIADTYNQDIEEVTPDGTLSVIAGDGGYGTPTYGVPATSSELLSIRAIASSPSGRLYLADPFSDAIDLLAPPVAVNVALPTVSGISAVGETLTSTTGAWSNDPIVYTYQWEDCDSSGASCTPVPGATSSTHVIASNEAGHTIRVVVTADNGGGPATATSAQTTLVPATPTTTVDPITARVAVSRRLLSAGLKLSRQGDVSIPLSCIGGGVCDARITFAIRRSLIKRGAGGIRTIARSGQVTIVAGDTRDLKLRLSPGVVRILRAQGSGRVRSTITITTSTGVQTERLWLLLHPVLDERPRLGRALLEQLADALGRQHVVDHQVRRADHAGHVTEFGERDLEVA
jgi:sugar lactone lactonase YvrE